MHKGDGTGIYFYCSRMKRRQKSSIPWEGSSTPLQVCRGDAGFSIKSGCAKKMTPVRAMSSFEGGSGDPPFFLRLISAGKAQ